MKHIYIRIILGCIINIQLLRYFLAQDTIEHDHVVEPLAIGGMGGRSFGGGSFGSLSGPGAYGMANPANPLSRSAYGIGNLNGISGTGSGAPYAIARRHRNNPIYYNSGNYYGLPSRYRNRGTGSIHARNVGGSYDRFGGMYPGGTLTPSEVCTNRSGIYIYYTLYKNYPQSMEDLTGV